MDVVVASIAVSVESPLKSVNTADRKLSMDCPPHHLFHLRNVDGSNLFSRRSEHRLRTHMNGSHLVVDGVACSTHDFSCVHPGINKAVRVELRHRASLFIKDPLGVLDHLVRVEPD